MHSAAQKHNPALLYEMRNSAENQERRKDLENSTKGTGFPSLSLHLVFSHFSRIFPPIFEVFSIFFFRPTSQNLLFTDYTYRRYIVMTIMHSLISLCGLLSYFPNLTTKSEKFHII